jgi:hypothetical protein
MGYGKVVNSVQKIINVSIIIPDYKAFKKLNIQLTVTAQLKQIQFIKQKRHNFQLRQF